MGSILRTRMIEDLRIFRSAYTVAEELSKS